MSILCLTLYNVDDVRQLIQSAKESPDVSDHTVRDIEEVVERYDKKQKLCLKRWKSLTPRRQEILRIIKKQHYEIVVIYNDLGGIKAPFLYRRYAKKSNHPMKITEADLQKFIELELVFSHEYNMREDCESSYPTVIYKVYKSGGELSEMMDLVGEKR